MKKDFLGDRRKGFEEEFFRRQEGALLQRLRDEEDRRSARQALAAASRITDEGLLDQLAALGVKPETLVALSLVPLVEIAWADGTVQDGERQAILEAARMAGLVQGSGGDRLLQGCLSAPPPAHLRTLWVHYIKTLQVGLSDQEREALKADLLERARRVAEAAGGFIGIGPKVSSQEAALLAEFAGAFGA
jgi:hypothetical protein